MAPHVAQVRVLARADHAACYAARLSGAEIREDPVPFQGPIAALRAGLPNAERLVVASVDAPGLRPRHVRRLLDAAGDQLAVASVDGEVLPTLMAGPRQRLRDRLDGATRLLDVVEDARRVPLAGQGLNVNTPEAARHPG